MPPRPPGPRSARSARSSAASPPPPRSLAEDLRSRTDDSLLALLRARPDLASPPPAGTTGLAARASTRASAQRALDRLDAPALQVLEVALALGEPVALPDLVAACGATARGAVAGVRALVAQLRESALLWGTDDGLRLVRSVADVLGSTPAGLGPPLLEALGTRSPARTAELVADLGLEGTGDPVADLGAVAAAFADEGRLSALLAGAPAPARELLDRLAWGPPTGAVAGAERSVRVADADGPLEWLLARGLLAPAGPALVVLPREVAVALRGGVVLAGLEEEPTPTGRAVAGSRSAALVDGGAAARAAEAVRLVEALLEGWSAAPPPVLRAGGLGVRETKRVTDRLAVDPEEAVFWIELVRAAGLAGDDGEADPAWAPTPAYDAWREGDAPARWGALAAAWLATSRVPGLVGEKDARGTARTALADDLDRTLAPWVRAGVLADLAALPAGSSAGAEDLVAHLRWRAPRRVGPLAERLVAWTLREAEWLGATASGALAAPARALLTDGRAGAVAALEAALPAPVDRVLLQADLTAVAPGPLVPAVAARLALLADVDSRGGATVYRFTPASVRRALDAGLDAEGATAFLRQVAATPVPQALEVLVADVARRHGQLRVGVAGSYLRSDDEATLAEVLADRRAAPLGLRRLAPTVAAARADAAKVLDVLRSMGLAPAPEGADADLVLRAPRAHRTPERTRPRPVTGEPPVVTDALAATLLAAVRTADGRDPAGPAGEAGGLGAGGSGGGVGADGAAAGRGPGPRALRAVDPPVALALLREAATEQRSVWVGVSDGAGRTSVHRLAPVGVEGGMVTALDVATGRVSTISVHRVTGVVPA